MSERKLLGRCGVDSGQIMLVDPCYVKDFDNSDYDEKRVESGVKDFSYNGACVASLSKDLGGELDRGMAVVTSTGYGDGCYEVWAEYEDGSWGHRVKRVTIEFIEDNEPDGSEESWEYRNRIEDDNTCSECGFEIDNCHCEDGEEV